MTSFIIVCIVLFFISIISNTAYVLNKYTENKAGAVLGIIIFSGMVVWSLTLLF